MAIRFDNKLKNEINRVVKNYNAKIRRLENKGFRNLPQTASVKQLKSDFAGKSAKRRELLYELRDLQRFSNRGAEQLISTSEGYNITKFELESANRRRIRSLRRTNRELKEQERLLKMLKNEKETNEVLQKISGVRKYISTLESISQNLRNKAISSRQRIKSISSTFSKFFSSKRKQNFYDNFFKALYDESGLIKLSDQDKKYLEETLGQLKPEELLEAERSNPLIKSIFEYYGVADESDEKSVSALFQNLISSAEDIVSEFSM